MFPHHRWRANYRSKWLYWLVFVNLTPTRSPPGRRESQLRNCLYRTGLWHVQGGIFVYYWQGKGQNTAVVPTLDMWSWDVSKDKLNKPRETHKWAMFLVGICFTPCLCISAVSFCLDIPHGGLWTIYKMKTEASLCFTSCFLVMIVTTATTSEWIQFWFHWSPTWQRNDYSFPQPCWSHWPSVSC